MPELPEIESLTRKISALLLGQRIVAVDFFRDKLREPIDKERFRRFFLQQTIHNVWRRSKYMLWETAGHAAIFHFGMSGIMVLQDDAQPTLPHTHAVFGFADSGERCRFLHFIDPRRFGLIACCTRRTLASHRLLAGLGCEPLATRRLGERLFALTRGKNCSIKTLLMDSHMIVGVGNIYASESLFLAGISPLTPARRLTLDHCRHLALHCKQVLRQAIAAGGTSFRDFVHPDRQPGTFAPGLKVYQRAGEPCGRCGATVTRIIQQQRSTFFCPGCQS